MRRSKPEDVYSTLIAVWWTTMGKETTKILRSKNWYNLRNTLRISLGVFAFKYILTPLAMRFDKYVILLSQRGYALEVLSREIFIFGIRVARWVISIERVRLPEGTPPGVEWRVYEEEEEEEQQETVAFAGD